MGFETFERIDSPTGATLALRSELATSEARAIVVICHGLAEHSARYATFARLLSSRFYHAYAPDHRGHGETTAPGAELGRFAERNGAERVVEDISFVRDLAASRHPGLPIILFGHSMGGMIATAAAEASPDRYDALAVWNSSLNPGAAGQVGMLLLKAERFFKGSDVPSRLGPSLTFDAWAKTVRGAKTPFDWLSHDAAQVARYVADPLCGFDASVSMWIDVISLADRAGTKTQLARLGPNLPVNLVGGGEDPATNGGRAMTWLAERMRSLGMMNVQLTLYPGMRHETLNEVGAEEAMKAFVAWADGVTSRLA
ncbi:alpha/beta fold hydrolase [Rhizobium alvei]|uniref:Alpha/beta hydrolase n=1 Tax=Rhizobium alvei TaxID=1132659 RepID=A0ABT8YJ50_9HYPH|nr:alpha/beta hydrolase [Rhizobium alvei]MDO6963546.1 alpha/beta hydrolase [Rhizobium alvei]